MTGQAGSAPKPLSAAEVDSVSLSREPGMVLTPAHHVTLWATGLVEDQVSTFDHGWHPSRREGRVDPSVVRDLVRSILQLGFADPPPDEGPLVTCQPTCELALSMDAVVHRLAYEGAEPAEFRAMITLVDATLNEVEWQDGETVEMTE